MKEDILALRGALRAFLSLSPATKSTKHHSWELFDK
jgi:hypothetical protein